VSGARTAPSAALAHFLRESPEGVRAAARRLKGTDRVLESVVGGRSMGAQLPDGAPIQIQLGERERFEPGEIVAFLNGSQVAVHRVLFCGRSGRRRGILITRGDAHLLPDLPISISAVLGTVAAVRGEAGWAPPEPAPRKPLAQRALAGAWLALAAALCRVELDLARRSLGWLYFAGRSLSRPLRRAS
jgi:hypothetical protein